MTKFKILFALLTLLIAFYYPSIKSAYDHYISLPYLNVSAASIALNSGFVNDAGIEREIIKSWKSLINLPARMTTANHEKKLKVLIGLNTNVDLILSGTDLFKAMNIDTKSRPQPHEHIASLNDFKESFMYYFKKGSAAERSFKTLGDFEAVLAASESLKNKEWFIGGNAGLMAQGISQRFADACEIILVGPVGPKLKDLLHPSVKVPSDCATESDEVHLILEYHAKESFEGLVSPQANRFIVSHDIYNSKMEMLSEFFNFTREFEPDIAILSGLHLLESQSFEFRNEKLEMVKNSLSNVKPDCIIHLELASFGDKSLMKMILDKNILPEINSLGLNEQELLFISHASENAPHSNYFTEINGQPDLTKVIDIMEWILNKFGADSTQDSAASKFTRIHFHCLMFHLIAEIETNSIWSNTISSLMSGSKIAAKQACGYDFNDESEQSYRDLEDLVEFRMSHRLDEQKNILFKIGEGKYEKLNFTMPVIQFKRASIKFSFTPVLVCKEPSKTVGLGDAISSSGILFSEFNVKK